MRVLRINIKLPDYPHAHETGVYGYCRSKYQIPKGISILTNNPPAGRLKAVIDPPWAMMALLAIASPKPLLLLLVVLPLRKNGSKIAAKSLSATPGPSSLIVN
jgi:hypothetical protein